MEKQQFVQIITRSRGIIRSLCKIYYRRVEDQQDAFQDVILQLWKSVDTFRGESGINTWIYRVTLNTILTKIRNERKSVAAEPLDVPHFYVSDAKADDQVELLSIIIQSLKDIDKAIVVLYLEGYRNKEIAEMLNIKPTNVSSRLNRITTQLKMKFSNKPYAIR